MLGNGIKMHIQLMIAKSCESNTYIQCSIYQRHGRSNSLAFFLVILVPGSFLTVFVTVPKKGNKELVRLTETKRRENVNQPRTFAISTQQSCFVI